MVMRPRFGPRGRSNRLLVLLFLALGCGGALLYHFESRGTMGKGLVTSLMRMEFTHTSPSLLYNLNTGLVTLLSPHTSPSGALSARADSWTASKDPSNYAPLTHTPFYSSGGAAVTHDPEHLLKGEHPIEVLMKRAEEQYAAVQEKMRSVVTLADAVRDYEETWKMPPPGGFDKWFELARKEGTIHVPSLIPESHSSWRTFMSIPQEILRARVHKQTLTQKWPYLLTISPAEDGAQGASLNVSNPLDPVRKKFWGCAQLRDLLYPVQDIIPPPQPGDPDTVLLFVAEAPPAKVAAWEVISQARRYTDEGKMFEEQELLELERKHKWKHGFKSTCPPDSPMGYTEIFNQRPMELDMKEAYPLRADVNWEKPKSFIADVRRATDYCENPNLAMIHSLLLLDTWRRNLELVPAVCQGATITSTDATWAPPMSAYVEVPEVPWSEKTDDRVLWRGTATGMKHSIRTAWRANQRHRLTQLANNATGLRPIYSPQADGSYRLEQHDVHDLALKYLDVGLTGGPFFCQDDDVTCDHMRDEIAWVDRVEPEHSRNYKYILDLDGHGWSQRFRKELTAGAVVIKSTIHQAWHSSHIIPWYHYVPAKVDYSDMFDIMAFFSGSPDGSVPGRDDLAEIIAKRGREHAVNHWRKEDMRSFTLLLVLEYHRMWATDRDAASFYLPVQHDD